MRTYERRYARVQCHESVVLETSNKLQLQANSENISIGGMEIRCDQVTAQAIMPLGYQLNPEAPLLLALSVILGEEKKPLQISCGILNTYRLAQDVFSFNLKFISVDEKNLKQLEQFMQTDKLCT